MNEPVCSLATVESVESDGLALRFDGEDTARAKVYKCLGSYIPAVGHRVCVMAISGTYLVLGQVVNAPAGSVAVADQAARANQIANQNFSSSDYDFQLRSTSASVFQIRRKNGSTWGPWYTITMT